MGTTSPVDKRPEGGGGGAGIPLTCHNSQPKSLLHLVTGVEINGLLLGERQQVQ
jgi:hypothetical protein